MKVEHFGCKKAQGVLQEFYAHIFTLNMVGTPMTSLVAAPAQDTIERKTVRGQLAYKYNCRSGTGKMRTGSGVVVYSIFCPTVISVRY
jgi:hypothetical protein